MLALPSAYRAIAPDQRGYGDADRNKKIDATRGMGDLAGDAVALLDALGIERAHVVGHSMGGSVIWRLFTDCPSRLLTADVGGTPCYADFAGSGAGTVSQNFVDLLAAGDRSETFPESPRVVMNSLYWQPTFRPAREEALLSSMLSTHVGKRDYRGDFTLSGNGPVPGKWGPLNAMSPKYVNDMERLYKASRKPPVLWVRGSHDRIVSDESALDLARARGGALQPMVSQTQAVLRKYAADGGGVQEEEIPDTGHTPFIEKPEAFNETFHAFLEKTDAAHWQASR